MRLASGALLLALALSTCQNPPDPADAGEAANASEAAIDPLVFAVVYQNEIDHVLQRANSDCEIAFQQLRDLLAARRAAFLSSQQALRDSRVESAELNSSAAQRLMAFAADCPDQAARFNELLRNLYRK